MEGERFEKRFPRSLRPCFKLHIPSKMEAVVRHHIPESRLRVIDDDMEVARELILLMIANLSNAYYTDQSDGWKRLSSSILRRQVSDSPDRIYRDILDLLVQGTTAKGPIIQENRHYDRDGHTCRSFRLTDVYRNKGVKLYELTTPKAKAFRERTQRETLERVLDMGIGRNMLALYDRTSIFTIDHLMEVGLNLIEQGFRNKKGKLLTALGKHSRMEFADADERVFLEDQVEIYRRVTAGGYMHPIISDEDGRVVDAFTLMPSWIRALVLIDHERTTEIDFSCLHPNIASMVFGGSGKSLTHQEIADELGIDKSTAKTAHLSFFNLPWEKMRHSPVWPFYATNEPDLIINLLAERTASGREEKDQHKETSRTMIRIEVELMSEVLRRLNERNIFPIYVYDALQGKEEDAEIIRETMNAAARQMGINTTAK